MVTFKAIVAIVGLCAQLTICKTSPVTLPITDSSGRPISFPNTEYVCSFAQGGSSQFAPFVNVLPFDVGHVTIQVFNPNKFNISGHVAGTIGCTEL